MKKIVKTQIKSLDSINSYESKAIYHQNTLKYKEDDVTVVMEINDDNIVLKRHNNDFNYTFTFNKNIPDYNILSLMNINKDLLQSILLCDSLGFHSFLQAKNFLNAIKMYFDANYKVRFNGEITIEYSKREIPLFIRNIHIR